MIGYHAVPELADAVGKHAAKSLGFDPNAALDAMVASAEYAPYGNLGEYMKLGYVPVDGDGEAASKTVEYAFDDWTIAETAHRLGREDVAARFKKRAENWRNVFNQKDGFVEPKLASGSLEHHSIRHVQARPLDLPKAMPGSTRGSNHRTKRA